MNPTRMPSQNVRRRPLSLLGVASLAAVALVIAGCGAPIDVLDSAVAGAQLDQSAAGHDALAPGENDPAIANRQREEGPPPEGPRPPDGRHGHRPDPILMALDTNQDRIISADELAAASEAILTLDRDGDGTVTPEELAPPPPPLFDDFVERIFERDLNGDGYLSPVELLPPHNAVLFDEADTDGDGLLSADELQTWFDEHPPPPPGGQ